MSFCFYFPFRHVLHPPARPSSVGTQQTWGGGLAKHPKSCPLSWGAHTICAKHFIHTQGFKAASVCTSRAAQNGFVIPLVELYCSFLFQKINEFKQAKQIDKLNPHHFSFSIGGDVGVFKLSRCIFGRVFEICLVKKIWSERDNTSLVWGF